MKWIDKKSTRSYSFKVHALEVSALMDSLNVRESLQLRAVFRMNYLNRFR